MVASRASTSKQELAQGREDDAISDKLQGALRQVFDAYDLGETGQISARDFIKLEIRHGFELGDISRIWEATPRLTKADQANNGHLTFDEFCQCRLRAYQNGSRARSHPVRGKAAWAPSQQGLTQCALEEAERTLQERERMGPRYHPGIRRALKELFCEINMSDPDKYDNFDPAYKLSPAQWVLAHAHLVKTNDSKYPTPCSSIVQPWFSEESFAKADTNKDGLLQRDEFLNLSFDVLEKACQRDIKTALSVTQEILQRLSTRLSRDKSLEKSVAVECHQSRIFQPPHSSRRGDNTGSYAYMGMLQIPSNVVDLEDLLGLLRLYLKLPKYTWFSVFFRSAKHGHASIIAHHEDVRSMLAALTDHNSDHTLYVKNFRTAPKDLEIQIPQPCDDKSFEERMERNFLSGRRWGLDWETQLCGAGCNAPIFTPFAIGDVLIIRIPESGSLRYNISVTVYMDQPVAVSSPYLETAAKMAESEKNKRGKRGAASLEPKSPQEGAPAKNGRRNMLADKNASQLLFVAQREGTCRLFIELSWENVEEEVSRHPSHYSQCQCPAGEVSVGRIGPLFLEVKPGVLPPEYAWHCVDTADVVERC
jgi:Ca2+-binding EF-hand superfamily protein